jgi:nucleotide-binding universal stress UspA family protein
MYTDLLFPTDGSDTATDAINDGFDLATGWNATVHLLHVAEPTSTVFYDSRPSAVDEVDLDRYEAAETAIAVFAEAARDRGLDVETTVRRGVAAEEIVRYADDTGIDLIVMSTRGVTGLDRVFLGSVTERVIGTAAVPVLVV